MKLRIVIGIGVVEPVGVKFPVSCPELLNPVPVMVKVSPLIPTETAAWVILALAPNKAAVSVLLQARKMTSDKRIKNKIFFIHKGLSEVFDLETKFSSRHGSKRGRPVIHPGVVAGISESPKVATRMNQQEQNFS